MIRRLAALLSFAAILTVFACKARQDQASAVKDGEATTDDSSPPNFDEFFTRFDNDIAVVESILLVGGGENLEAVEGLALQNDGGASGAGYPNDAVAEAMALAEKLKALAKETVIAQRVEVEAMAIELEAMAQLLASDLAGTYQTRIDEAIRRVRGILDAPPPKKTEVAVEKPKPPVVKPTPPPPPKPEINYDALTCADLGDGSYLPKVIATGRTIGVRSNPGYKGFNNYNNCSLAIGTVEHHLVCSLSATNKISPFNTKTEQMLGPVTAFEHTKNCVLSVSNSRGSNFICLVDNSSSAGNKFAKYSVSDGRLLDYWFDTEERCRRGDKSADPRVACIDRCKLTSAVCKNVAAGYRDMEKVRRDLDCMLQDLKCQDRC